jgi:hypothetical protein
MTERLNTLINVIKTELTFEYDQFIVKLIQLYYDDNEDDYMEMKMDNITNDVCC